jgi:hypothetical protein
MVRMFVDFNFGNDLHGIDKFVRIVIHYDDSIATTTIHHPDPSY